MDTSCICIAYNGKWTTDNKYLDHETKLILVNDEITCEGLVEKISQVLKLNRRAIEANIWFDTKLETSKGMLVTNNEEVTTCIYLLKNDPNFKTSRFIVDIAESNSLPEKSSKTKLCTVHEEANVVPQDQEEGLLEMLIVKDETVIVGDEACIMAEPITALEYSSTEEKSEEAGSIRESKRRKRWTGKRDDLPTMVLREDASLDGIFVGSVFKDKESLKKCFSRNAIKEQFKFKVGRSTNSRYYLQCYDDECSWYLHASQVRGSSLFKVTKFFQTHSCSVDVLSDQRHITSRVLSDYIIEFLRDTKAEITPNFVMEEVRKRYGLSISYNKAWRATQLALGATGIPEQNHEESNPETSDIERDDLPTVVLRKDASLDEIVVGSIFQDKESLKKCLANNAIKHHFKFKVDRSTQKRYSLKCYDDQCSWQLYSSQVRQSSLFRVTKFFQTHSCSFDVLSDQHHATYKVISDYIIELIHETGEDIKPNFVVEEIRRRYGLKISYHKAWRAIQLAVGVTEESPDHSPEFCPMEESNLETCTEIEIYDQTHTQFDEGKCVMLSGFLYHLNGLVSHHNKKHVIHT